MKFSHSHILYTFCDTFCNLALILTSS